jgi:radical SAM superfamily enzyme YgiQ (UPF0313 family)
MKDSNKLRVLLVQSYLGDTEPQVLPLGLLILAGSLSKHEVAILDLNVESKPFHALKEAVARFKPDVVGVSLRNIDSTNKREVIFYYKHLRPTLNLLRNGSVEPLIIVGGAGFSMYADRIMQDEDNIDFGIYLEGEDTLPELLENLDHPERVKGVYYRQEGNVVFTGQRGPGNFAGIPSTRWDLLDIKQYSVNPDGIGLETKRGCSMKCAYCPYPFLNGPAYRLKPVERVLDEIKELTERHNIHRITFTDSVFNIPLSHAENICRGIIERKLDIRWSAWFNEKNITREFILLAKEAGCINFIFSPDGFSDSVLRKIGKNISEKDISKTYDIVREIEDIKVSYNFFKNPPGQSIGAAMAMIKFFIKAKAELGKDRVSFELNSLRIEPHTPLHKIAVDEGIIDERHDLLFPAYYTSPKTKYIETFFNLIMRLKGK